MKILIYINNIGKGSMSCQAAELANALSEGEDTVYLLTDLCKQSEYVLNQKVNRFESVCEAEDSKFHVILKNLKKRIADISPDVILAFGCAAGKRAVKVSGGKHKIYLADYKTPGTAYAGKKEFRDTLKLYEQADGIVVQTQEAREFWSEKLQDKIHIILSFMREKYYGDTGRIPSFEERKPVIAYTGQFKEGSGHLALVKAFERILEDYPDYTLAFYGNRSEDNTIFQVQELVRAHKLTNQVKFLGDSTQEELLQSKVFVMPAITPGISVSVMEAMALGLPVVVSDHEMGSVRMVIDDGYNGLTFQAGNEEELYIAIKKYLDHPMEAERIANEAVKVKETFSRERILAKWCELWEGK